MIHYKKLKIKNTFVYADEYNFFFENTSIYKIFQFENINFNSYISFLISKKLNLKILKSNRNKKIIFFEKFKKKTIFKKYIYFVYQIFMRLFKPILILDVYFGKKNSLKVTLKSKFKIIFANIDYFDFPRNQITFKKDVKSRSKISIKLRMILILFTTNL